MYILLCLEKYNFDYKLHKATFVSLIHLKFDKMCFWIVKNLVLFLWRKKKKKNASLI